MYALMLDALYATSVVINTPMKSIYLGIKRFADPVDFLALIAISYYHVMTIEILI
jgi:hypothetical protein